MENKITYLKKTSFGKVLFGLVLLLLGLYTFLFNNVIAGTFLFGIGISLLTAEGSEIDLDNNTYRLVRSIFGFHFGKWKPCPEFDYITVFRTKDKMSISTMIPNAATIQTDAVFINLFFKNRKHITVYKAFDKLDAFKAAEHFKSALRVDILDATERQKVWL